MAQFKIRPSKIKWRHLGYDIRAEFRFIDYLRSQYGYFEPVMSRAGAGAFGWEDACVYRHD